MLIPNSMRYNNDDWKSLSLSLEFYWIYKIGSRGDEQGTGMKTEEWKGVDDKSRDYVYQEQEGIKRRKMNSEIINLIVFSSVSYRTSEAASCIKSEWTWIIFHAAAAALHSEMHFKVFVLLCLEWKVMLNFPNITSRTHKLCAPLNANYWDVIFVFFRQYATVAVRAERHPVYFHIIVMLSYFICKQ